MSFLISARTSRVALAGLGAGIIALTTLIAVDSAEARAGHRPGAKGGHHRPTSVHRMRPPSHRAVYRPQRQFRAARHETRNVFGAHFNGGRRAHHRPHYGYAAPFYVPRTVAPPVYYERAPSAWVGCAREHGVCYLPYPTTVRYGNRGRYATRRLAGPVTCDNYTFGDPLPGYGKGCAYLVR